MKKVELPPEFETPRITIAVGDVLFSKKGLLFEGTAGYYIVKTMRYLGKGKWLLEGPKKPVKIEDLKITYPKEEIS